MVPILLRVCFFLLSLVGPDQARDDRAGGSS